MNALEQTKSGELGAIQAEAAGRPKALLAIDNSLAREILTQQLQTVGFEVCHADSGSTAWDALHNTEPQLTVLLLSQAASDAAELVRKLRKEQRFENHPIWICTLLPSLRHSRSAAPGATSFCNLLSTSIFTMIGQMAAQAGIEARAIPEELPNLNRSETTRRIEEEILDILSHAQALASSGDEMSRPGHSADLSQKFGALVIAAAVAGRCQMARHAAAVRSLLDEATVRPATLSSRCLSTIISAAERLVDLNQPDTGEPESATAIVLSDTTDRRGATESALKNACFQVTTFTDNAAGLEHLKNGRVDLIVTHLHTPEGEIAELCREIRKLPEHAETPIQVAAVPSQIKSVEAMLAAGATEVVFQPFSQMELAVSGLLLTRHRTTFTPEKSAETPAAAEKRIDPAPNLPTLAAIPARGSESATNGQNDSQRCKELERQLDEVTRLFLEAGATAAEEHRKMTTTLEANAEMSAKLKEKESEAESKTAELESLGAKQAKLEEDCRELAKKKEEAEEALTRAKEAIATTPSEWRERLEAQVERERAEKRRIEQRMASLNKHLEELHATTSRYFETERMNQDRIASLEEQLHERDEALARTKAELQKETTERNAAVEQLRIGETLMKELQEASTVYSSAKEALQRRHESMEARLKASEFAASQAQEEWKVENSQRTKLQEELTTARQRSEELDGAVARMKCELELAQAENKHLAGEMAKTKYDSLEAIRVNTASVKSLRDRLREPLDTLVKTARQLLESELAQEIKPAIERMLENSLALQSRVNE